MFDIHVRVQMCGFFCYLVKIDFLKKKCKCVFVYCYTCICMPSYWTFYCVTVSNILNNSNSIEDKRHVALVNKQLNRVNSLRKKPKSECISNKITK